MCNSVCETYSLRTVFYWLFMISISCIFCSRTLLILMSTICRHHYTQIIPSSVLVIKNDTKIKRNELILYFNVRSYNTILYLILYLWYICVAFCHLWCVSAMHQGNLCRRGSNTPPIIHCPIWWYRSSLISEYNLSVSGSMAWSVFAYKLRYIVDFGLVEMAISTNRKPTIYRNLYENTGPGAI